MAKILFLAAVSMMFVLSGFAEEQKPAPPELDDRVYHVPPGFFTTSNPSNNEGDRKPQPGVVPIPNRVSQFDITGLLKDAGVEIPPGGKAVYFQDESTVLIRATPQSLDLTDVFFEPMCNLLPKTLRFEVSAVECALPAESFSAPSNLSCAELERLAGKSMKLLARVAVVSKTGQRALVSHVNNAVATAQTKPADASQINSSPTPFVSGESGIKVESELILGPDGQTIDANIFLRFRPAEMNLDVEFTTSVALWDDYPAILNISSIPKTDGKFIAIIARARVVNPGGWKVNRKNDVKQPEVSH